MLRKIEGTGRGFEAFLKDWEKARETLGEISKTAGARKGGR
jgi:hypothetical protein